jgi:hypothetical protein
MRGGCRVATVRWPIEPPLGRAPPSRDAGGPEEAGGGPGPPLRPHNDGARDGFWVYRDSAGSSGGAGPAGPPAGAL